MHGPWRLLQVFAPSLLRAAILGLGLLAGTPLSAAEEQRAILPVTVNEVEKGDFLVILRSRDVLVRVGDLEVAGVHGFGGRRAQFGSDEFVSLESLAPGVNFGLDLQSLTLRLTVPPAWLESTTVDLGNRRPAGLVYGEDTSAFFNYGLNWRSVGSDAFGEVGLSRRGNLMYSSMNRTPEGEVVRGLTNYTIDDRENQRRWVVGDTFASAGSLGGALFLGGVSFSRNFSLDPYFVRYPTLAVSGAVTTPSTVDVYVNGSVVRREQLPPGDFDLTNLVVPTGSGTAQFVIRDVFGRERTLTNPFYASTAVLARGLTEYTYNLGLRREQVGTSDSEYGSLAFLGRHRFGLTDSFTPGMRLEAGSGLVSGGPGLAVRLPYGEVEGSMALSRDGDQTGSAWSVVYQYIGRSLNFGVFTRAQSSRYAHLGLTASQDRPRREANAFAGLQLGSRTSITVNFDSIEMRDTPSFERVSLLSNVSLARRANLFVSAGRARRDGDSVNEAFLGLSVFLGRRTTAGVSFERQGDAGATSVDVQRSLPLGTGFGYRVNGVTGDERSGGSGAFLYQGPFGRYEAGYENLGGEEFRTLNVSGGVVALGGVVSATRSVGGSYALIRVPGVEGVAGFSSNQPIGATNGRGDLLVPDLLPYYGNRLGIDDQDLPLDYEIEATEKIIAPPFRGGAIVDFPVRRIRSVRGSVVLAAAGEQMAPAYGELRVTAAGKRLVSPLGAHGEFYLEGLPVGTHPARVEWSDGICDFVIEIPASEDPFLDIGTVGCPVGE